MDNRHIISEFREIGKVFSHDRLRYSNRLSAKIHGGEAEVTEGQLTTGTETTVKVAVKRFKNNVIESAVELKLLHRAKHPNIVQLIGLLDGSSDVLLLEWADQGSLYDALHKKRLENVNVKKVAHDVALALQYLHGQKPPIIHRDLSSKNILLFGNNVAKVLLNHYR